MRDYYKILGVRDNASEAEIRQHWIEWMKKLHPDQHQENARIREINEAYQVLKYSSTRVEYDLKRAHERRKKGFSFRRVLAPVFVCCLVAAGLLQIKRTDVGVVPLSSTERTVIVMRGPDVGVAPAGATEPLNAEHPKAESDIPRKVLPQDTLTVEAEPVSKIEHAREPVRSKAERPRTAHQRKGSLNREMPARENRVEKADRSREHSKTPAPEQIPVPDQPVRPVEAGLTVTPVIEVPSPPLLSGQEQGEPPPQDSLSVAASLPLNESAPCLLAEEDEVRRLLSLYAERYMRKDLEGFLSLFSPSAVQNGKDRFERIRSAYAHFLDRSREIRYRLFETKIEPYENSVEVNSRYELIQTPERGGRDKVWIGRIRWVLTKENGTLKIVSLDYEYQANRRE